MDAPPPPSEELELKGYVERLVRRMGAIETELKRIAAEEHGREERLGRLRSGLRAESFALQEEVRRVEERLRAAVKETARLVNEFRSSARRQQFSRIGQRVDAWKGEQYISRDEFKRLLRKEMG